MIDVIIPIYNVNIEQLEKCLLSVVAQTIVKELEITIVDDGSSIINKELNGLLEKVRTFVPIRILRYKENRGPGYARQYGINHTYNDYIMFIDADDMFLPTAAETLLRGFLLYPDKAISMGKFYDFNSETMICEEVDIQLTWVFAKMYKRAIIKKYGFSFNTNKNCSYGNEDVGFNCQFQFLLGPECTVWTEQPLYYWSNYNKNSITRKNNHEYSYTSGYKGYVMNFIYTYFRFKNKATKNQSEWYAFKHLFDIYDSYFKNIDIVKKNEKIKQELLKYAYLYYVKVFQDFDNENNILLKKYWNDFEDINKDKNFDVFYSDFFLLLRQTYIKNNKEDSLK